MQVECAPTPVARLLVVQGGRCTVELPRAEIVPQAVVTLTLRTLLETVSGMRHFDEAYRKRDMRIEGDLFFALELRGWFFYP